MVRSDMKTVEKIRTESKRIIGKVYWKRGEKGDKEGPRGANILKAHYIHVWKCHDEAYHSVQFIC